ncbi:MAG: hypothetical protein LBR82_00250 [Desulfovibrio sp.]|jgi:hypothetical protein|nr:hypothetical protein [Desulfovibrio sp.]
MQSTVQLYNLALARLGGDQFQPLTSPQEDDALAKLCQTLFPHVLDMTLQAHSWGFALRTVILPQVAIPQDGNGGVFSYRYQMPSDCVRPVRLQGGRNHSPAYQVHGSNAGAVLLTDEAPATLIYVARETDPKRWPAMFADALAWGLASELATARINDPQRQQFYVQMYRGAVTDAAAQNMRENNPQPMQSGWNTARFGSDIDIGGIR